MMRAATVILVIGIAGCGSAAPAAVQPSPAASAPTPSKTASLSPESAPQAPAPEAPAPEAPAASAKPGPRVATLPGTSIRFSGGDGSSARAAIKILGAKGESEGVAAEYRYLDLAIGPRASGAWQSMRQSLLEESGRQIDALEIRHADGRTETVYFDITEYFGKF
jgi:hypothetical protein